MGVPSKDMFGGKLMVLPESVLCLNRLLLFSILVGVVGRDPDTWWPPGSGAG